MDGIGLQKGVQNIDTIKEPQDGGVDRSHAGGFTVDTSSKNITQTVVEIRLLLGARKRSKLRGIEVNFKLFFPSPKGGSGSIVLELFGFELQRGRLGRRARNSRGLKRSRSGSVAVM